MPCVAALTAPFVAKHPSVTIDVRSMTSAEIQRGLDKFEIDAGMTYLESEPLTNVRKVALYRERYVFVTSKCSETSGRSITWKEAANYDLCLLNETMQNRRVLNNFACSLGLQINPSITTNSFLAVCSHVTSGQWSSIIPQTFAYIFRGCEDLRMLDLVEPVHSQTIGVVASGREPLTPLARAVLTCAARVNLETEFNTRNQVFA